MSLNDGTHVARASATLATAVAVAIVVAGCQRDSAPVPGPARSASAAPVVAVVNGTPITAADLALAMTAAVKGNPHQAGETPATPPARDEVLDRLIGEELAAQRAVARGLDADPGFQEELATRQAQLDSFRRQRLASLLQRDVREHAAVSEADARRFFDERADRIRTVTRVWQILLHDRAAIERAQRALADGGRFEEVAARELPNPPAGATPWDLGPLKWNQIPEPWVDVIDGLAIGATSPIIEGPRGRLWIVKVVDRRVDPAITFESARPAILTVLQSKAAEAAQVELERALRDGATISRTPIPVPGA